MRYVKYDEMTWKPGPATHRDPQPWEIQVLNLISEHIAIPMDLLARLLKISPERTALLMSEFASYRWVNVKQFLAADEPWVWLRQIGVDHATTGFRRLTPKMTGLPHRRAVCAIRIDLEDKHADGFWTSERALADHRRAGNLPDAAFEVCVDNKRKETWAIEAELSVKGAAEYRKVAKEHTQRFDKVLYFCTPQVAKLLRRIPEIAGRPTIAVYDFFKEPADLSNFQWAWSPTSGPNSSCIFRRAKQWEAAVLRLVAEQYAISVEHLARFLECGYDRAQQIVDHLDEAGFLEQGRGPAEDSPWVWVTRDGARASGTGVRYRLPRPTSTKRLGLANEARLYVAERDWNARWTSKRLLRRGAGRAHLPTAIVESEDLECAIEVETRQGIDRLVKKYNHRCKEYEAVSVFCSRRRVKTLERLKREHGWENLFVQPLGAIDKQHPTQEQPRPAVQYAPIPLEELPSDALRVVQEAEELESPSRPTGASYARGPGAPRWRIATSQREWRVMHMPFGWIAQPCDELDEPLASADSDPSTGEIAKADGGYPRTSRQMVSIPVSKLPAEAMNAIRLAAGLQSAPTPRAVQRRRGPGFPRWRVETDQGVWRVAWNPQNGFAANPVQGEERPVRPRRKPWPKDPPGTMVDIDPKEMPHRVTQTIQEAADMAEIPRVTSASRRRGVGSPRWRVETDQGVWRVTNGSHGWTASPAE